MKRPIYFALLLASCSTGASVTVEEATTSVATTIPSTTTTTTLPPTTTTTEAPTTTTIVVTTTTMPEGEWKCPQWYDAAMSAGFTPDQWPTVDRIMYRESRCQPEARSVTNDTGLMQMNDIHLKWLKDYGITQADLYDGPTNLVAAHLLFTRASENGCGWSPWRGTC